MGSSYMLQTSSLQQMWLREGFVCAEEFPEGRVAVANEIYAEPRVPGGIDALERLEGDRGRWLPEDVEGFA